MNGPVPEALLFDLGGVLIDIDFGRALARWQSRSRLSPDAIAAAFSFDAAYERHERGEIGADEYFRHLACTLALDGDLDHVAAGWNAIFVEEIAETLALVNAARSRIPCYVFSNTNAAHMREWTRRFPAVAGAFDRIFTSHELGLRKPESAAFAAVVREIGRPPASIVFFDDLPENVRAARAAGLRAVHVRSPADVRDVLQQAGCIE